MKRVAVVGAGLGGLSAAAHLASYGYNVTVFEKEKSPGGRARRIAFDSSNGRYNLDCGPTVFTMLDIARKPFAVLDMEMDRLVNMIKVSPSYKGIYGEGDEFSWPSEGDVTKEIGLKFGEKDAAGYKSYESWLEKLYNIEYEPFIAKNYYSFFDLVSQSKDLLLLLKMGAFRKLDKKVSSYIDDERLKLMLTFQSLYAGVTPNKALAIYSIISYMDLVKGVYYPKGGMCTYPEALAEACSNAGVKFEFGDSGSVERIRKSSGKCEIQINSLNVEFDAVICNADLPYAYPDLFEEEMPRRVKKGKYSPSCFLYVVGGEFKKSQNLSHHNIIFSKNTQHSFRQLIDKKEVMSEPSVLISNPTYTDKSIAPKGRDIFYILEPSPNLSAKSLPDSEAVKGRMQGHMENAGLEASNIDCEVMFTPSDWEEEGFYKGTPFSLAHTFFQSGPFRPSNQMKSIPGLFLCGTGTTPGVGIPMVIESGKLAAEKARKYLEAR